MVKKKTKTMFDVLWTTEQQLNKVIKSIEYIYDGGWVQRNEIYHILKELELIKSDLITADIMKMSQQLKWSKKKESNNAST
jgi:hypothetical protein